MRLRWPGYYLAVGTRHFHLGGLIEDAAGDQEQQHQKPETRSKSIGRQDQAEDRGMMYSMYAV